MNSCIPYFDSTWMNSVTNGTTSTLRGPHTNNHVEGWHSRLKKVVGKPHPNIYEIIDVFKKEEVSTKVKMHMLEAAWSTVSE